MGLFELDPQGLGFDFLVIWQSSLSILHGQSPYAIPGSLYSPATAYLFSPLALLPAEASFILLTVLSCAALGFILRRPVDFLWLLFWPVGQILYSGQTSLLFVPIITLIAHPGRRTAAVSAALLTLKPQIAVVVLPWYILRWLLRDRVRAAYFAGVASAIHLAPLAFRPSMYSEWFDTFSLALSHKKVISSGIWLSSEHLPDLLLWITALLLALFIFKKNEQLSRSALTLASPVTSFYDTVILMPATPAYLLVPVSLVALLISRSTASYLSAMMISGAAFLYHLLRHPSERSRTTQPDRSSMDEEVDAPKAADTQV